MGTSLFVPRFEYMTIGILQPNFFCMIGREGKQLANIFTPFS